MLDVTSNDTSGYLNRGLFDYPITVAKRTLKSINQNKGIKKANTEFLGWMGYGNLTSYTVFAEAQTLYVPEFRAILNAMHDFSTPPLQGLLSIIIYAEWRKRYVDEMIFKFSPDSDVYEEMIRAQCGDDESCSTVIAILSTTWQHRTVLPTGLKERTTSLVGEVEADLLRPSDDLSIYDVMATRARTLFRWWLYYAYHFGKVSFDTSYIESACKAILEVEVSDMDPPISDLLSVLSYVIFRQTYDLVTSWPSPEDLAELSQQLHPQ